jgi:hypothetical protein
MVSEEPHTVSGGKLSIIKNVSVTVSRDHQKHKYVSVKGNGYEES